MNPNLITKLNLSPGAILVDQSVTLPFDVDITPRFGDLLATIDLSDREASDLIRVHRLDNETGLYETCFGSVIAHADQPTYWNVSLRPRFLETAPRFIDSPVIPDWLAFLRHFATLPPIFGCKDEFDPQEPPFGL